MPLMRFSSPPTTYQAPLNPFLKETGIGRQRPKPSQVDIGMAHQRPEQDIGASFALTTAHPLSPSRVPSPQAMHSAQLAEATRRAEICQPWCGRIPRPFRNPSSPNGRKDERPHSNHSAHPPTPHYLQAASGRPLLQAHSLV